jgi:hypothetical protein
MIDRPKEEVQKKRNEVSRNIDLLFTHLTQGYNTFLYMRLNKITTGSFEKTDELSDGLVMLVSPFFSYLEFLIRTQYILVKGNDAFKDDLKENYKFKSDDTSRFREFIKNLPSDINIYNRSQNSSSLDSELNKIWKNLRHGAAHTFIPDDLSHIDYLENIIDPNGQPLNYIDFKKRLIEKSIDISLTPNSINIDAFYRDLYKISQYIRLLSFEVNPLHIEVWMFWWQEIKGGILI